MSICSIGKCERAIFAKRLCSTHYKKQWRPPEYRVWDAMKQRCNNPNNKKYHLYGGRGIKLCDSWLNFNNFIEDMGRRPEGSTIDRIDPDKGYEPSNCRWATYHEQNMHLGVRSDSKSGVRGVTWEKRRNAWVVNLHDGKRIKYFGQYKNKQDAINMARKVVDDRTLSVSDRSN